MRLVRSPAAFVTCLAFGAVLLTGADAAAQSRPPALFTVPAAQADARPVVVNRHARRTRTLQARVAALDGASGTGNAVVLNLFDDVSFTARRTAIERRGSNNYTWQGRLDGDRDGRATLVVNGAVVMGTVFTHGHTYEIASTGNGLHEVRELDPASFPTDDPPLLAPDIPPGANQPAAVAPALDTTALIDVLVVWTPAARAAVGSSAAMQSLVALAVANANTAYANSHIAAQLRLVYSAEVSFTETAPDIAGDLGKLATNGDGALDTVQTLRNQYAADVVSLIGTGYTSGSGACGIGYLMTTVSTGFASSAFNVVDQACAAGNLSFAHEVGHNEGLHHDPANASGQGAYPYAFGYQDPGGLFRTVMSYGSSTRIPYFSNPNITYGGKPTGVANAQDNARALNNTAATVASFRTAVAPTCNYTVTPLSIPFAAAGGSSTVTVTTTPSCAWTVTNPSGWIATDTTSGTGTGSFSVSVGANGPSARSATLTVAGRSVTVSQPALACSYTVVPSSTVIAAAGGAIDVTVSTPSKACGWATSISGAWLSASLASSSGTGVVTITATANNGPQRSGTVTIAGHTVTLVEQAPAGLPAQPKGLRVVPQ